MPKQHHRDLLSLTGRRWIWPSPGVAGEHFHPSMPRWSAQLLAHRGLTEPDQVTHYLTPLLSKLDDPALMADMGTATERIYRAIVAAEPMTIYGDYDVDGVVSTTILVQFLRQLGGSVDYYIPDRRAEGYGLNKAAIATIASRSRLLITTDCGITACAEIALANQLGLDVIVVDHHRVGSQLPPAVANLNPHRPDCGYPFKGLCAAGVAFMLLVALRRKAREEGAFVARREPDLRETLDLVALATVADMVPMLGANRILVASGLKRLAVTQRPGLRALMAVAKLDPTCVTATDLGFRLAPRINARGRLSHAAAAVELLLTDDKALSSSLAAQLDQANRERRDVERQTADAALAQIERRGLADHAALVVDDAAWHPGVLGLVAARLAARFNRPAIAIGEGGKGSGRSVEGLDLHACITAAGEHLVRFGGHAAAAGVTVMPEKINAFRDLFIDQVQERLGKPPFVASLKPDVELTPDALNLDMMAVLDKLSPFGQGNPEPLFVVRNMTVEHRRVVGGEHLKLRLSASGLDAIAFGLGAIAEGLPDRVDVAFHAERNFYNGRQSLQLRVADMHRCAP